MKGPLVARWILVAALLWAAWSFGTEVWRRLLSAPATAPPDRPSSWVLRSPPVVDLKAFLARVDALLPADSVVAYAPGSELADSEDFFFYMWVAYYLPRHDVVRLKYDYSREIAEYVLLSPAGSLGHPRLREIHREAGGVLYEVKPE